MKPRSKKEIYFELNNKGISRLIIEESINELMDDEFDVACTIFKKRFADYDLHDNKIISKIYNYFSGKGFNEEVIKKTILFYKNTDEV